MSLTLSWVLWVLVNHWTWEWSCRPLMQMTNYFAPLNTMTLCSLAISIALHRSRDPLCPSNLVAHYNNCAHRAFNSWVLSPGLSYFRILSSSLLSGSPILEHHFLPSAVPCRGQPLLSFSKIWCPSEQKTHHCLGMACPLGWSTVHDHPVNFWLYIVHALQRVHFNEPFDPVPAFLLYLTWICIYKLPSHPPRC